MSKDLRIEKIQSTIFRELNLILKKDFSDSEILTNLIIHEVRLTNDVGIAKVFYSVLTNDFFQEDVEKEIKDNLKEIRMVLASKIFIKAVPELVFVKDNSLENANKIEEILNNLNKK